MRIKRTSIMTLVLLMIVSSLPLSAFADSIVINANANMTVTREFSRNDVVIHNTDSTQNTVDIKYKITPADISPNLIPDITPAKEVVLVIDVSGSMQGNRINVVRESAKQFADTISKNSNIKIGLVKYSDKAEYVLINGNKLIDVSKNNEDKVDNVADFKTAVNTLTAGGGTNVGDGIRLGYHALKNGSDADKFLVFLTDGETNYYTRYYKNGWKEYFGAEQIGASGNTDNPSQQYYYGDPINYAKRVADMCTIFNKNYFVGVSTSSSTLQTIAGDINRYNYDYRQTTDADGIANVYNDISFQIAAEASVTQLSFEDTLPTGVSYIDTISVGGETDIIVKSEGQKLSVGLEDISYKYDETKNMFVADPIEIIVKVKVTSPGKYVFNKDDVKIKYTDVNTVVTTQTSTSTNDELRFTRKPVTGVVTSRPTHASGNPDNKVAISWDKYDGGLTYNIYRVVNGVDEFIETINDGAATSTVVDIKSNDTATTEYKVEAILAGNEKSGKGSSTADTNPSVLNAYATRENNVFKVTWDKIPGASSYRITPYIIDKYETPDATAGKFVEIGGKIQYEYELENPTTYGFGDKIKFRVEGFKLNTTVKEDITNELSLKQVVTTAITTELDEFYYAKAKTVDVAIQSDAPFPTGVDLYDPMIVVDLILPENLATPLEFTYSTIKLDSATVIPPTGEGAYSYSNLASKAITVTRVDKENLKIYIQLNDYKSKVLPEGNDFKLSVNFAIAYKSDANGKLDDVVFKTLKGSSDLQVYQIETKIHELLDTHYTEDVDKMIQMKTSFMYNSEAKLITEPLVRDEVVGISAQFIKLINVNTISDEF